MALRYFLRNNWPAITITVTVVAIFIVALVTLRNMPPRMIVMATGSEGGSFYDVGERYRAALASAGVEVRLVPTAGSAENLALLLDPNSGVNVGLVQGGTIGAEASSKLESLGTLFYEPLWLFHKREVGNTKGHLDLRGRRISVGPVGSGGRALSLELLKRNGIDGQVSDLLSLAHGSKRVEIPAVPARLSAEFEVPHYIRFMVNDKPGIIADITVALAKEGINIRAIVQKPGYPSHALPFVMTVEPCKPSALKRAMEAMRGRNYLLEAPLDLQMLE